MIQILGTIPGYFDRLREAVAFEQRSVTVYGQTYPQPRLTKWYGPKPYLYSGIAWEPADMPTEIETLRREVSFRIGLQFNSVLCNLYRDGNDTVGWHSDDEPIFGPDPEVASLSYGSTRIFRVRRKDDHKVKMEFELSDGTLLHMGKGVQQEWQHSIPRTRNIVGPRINLTFRVVP